MKNWDKFYTRENVAKWCVEKILKALPESRDKEWFEPAAGNGRFLDACGAFGVKATGADLKPERQDIIEADFLKSTGCWDVIFGNPPFGPRFKLALAFLNHALTLADTVAFILPKAFLKYNQQKLVLDGAKLIFSAELPKNSFTFNGRIVDVGAVLQIWTVLDLDGVEDLRLKKQLRALPGLKTWIYNNTPATMKFCDQSKYGWDFAVVRGGYYDYTQKIYQEKDLKMDRQYLLVKVEDADWWPIIQQVDFTKLSQLGTTVPCYATSDFLQELVRIKTVSQKSIIITPEDQ